MKKILFFAAVIINLLWACNVNSSADNFEPNTALPAPIEFEGIVVDRVQDLAANEYFRVACGRDTLLVPFNKEFGEIMNETKMGEKVAVTGSEFETISFKNLTLK